MFCPEKLLHFLYLEEVVDDDCVPEVVWLPPGHEPGPGELDAVEVEAADGHSREGGVHQSPVVHARVAELPTVGE